MTDWRGLITSLPIANIPQLGRFVSVGILTCTLFLGLSNGLALLQIAQPGPAAGIAILTSGVLNYSLHRLYTFESIRTVKSSLPRYVLLLLANTLLGSILVGASTSWLGIAPLFANLACGAVITLLSFVIMRTKVM